jgi:type IV secretory pathway VirB3-like protein
LFLNFKKYLPDRHKYAYTLNTGMLAISLKFIFLTLVFSFIKTITLVYVIIQTASFAEAYTNVKKPYKIYKCDTSYQISYTPLTIEVGGGHFFYAKVAHNLYVNSVFTKMYFLVTKKTYNYHFFAILALTFLRNYCLYLVGVNYFFFKIAKAIIQYQDDKNFISYLLETYSNCGDSRNMVFINGCWITNPTLLRRLKDKMGFEKFAALTTRLYPYLGYRQEFDSKNIELVSAKFTQDYIKEHGLIKKPHHLVLQNVGVQPNSIYMTAYDTRINIGGTYPGTVTAVERFEGPSKLSSGVSIPTRDLVIDKRIAYLPQKHLIAGMKTDGYKSEYVNKDYHEIIQTMKQLESEIEFLSQNSGLGPEDLDLFKRTYLGINPPTPLALEAEIIYSDI